MDKLTEWRRRVALDTAQAFPMEPPARIKTTEPVEAELSPFRESDFAPLTDAERMVQLQGFVGGLA